jgi:hypothetical protein
VDISWYKCSMAQTNGGKSLWMQNFAVRSANGTQRSLYNTWDEEKLWKD